MLINIKKTMGQRKAFTLIEVVIVIAILSVLAFLIVPNIAAYRARADDERIMSNMKSFWTSSEMIDKLEKEYTIGVGEIANNDFKLKAGEYANEARQDILDRYKVSKDNNGITLEYLHTNDKTYYYPEKKVENADSDTAEEEQEIPPNYPELRSDFVKSATIIPYSIWNIEMVKDQVKELKLNTVNVPIRVIVDNPSSNDMSIHEGDLGHSIALVKELKAMGIKVILEPFPWIANGSVGENAWNPTNVNTWFWNWKTKVLKRMIDEVATPNSVEFLTISNNFQHIEYATGYWEDLFRDVKTTYGYSGEIIYKTHWWYTATWDAESTNQYNAKLNNPLFGSSYLDVISIAAYFELTDVAHPTVEQLKIAMTGTKKYNRGQNVVQEIKNFNTKWGKDIFFGELGAPNYAGYASEPWNPTPNGFGGEKSQTAQYNFFRAYIDTFGGQDWYKGFTIFVVGDVHSHYNITNQNARKYIRGL